MTRRSPHPLPTVALLILPLMALAACTDPPDLDNTVDPALEAAEFPALVPVEQILGPDAPDTEADAQTAESLEARAAGLQARASRLQRTSAIDDETRRRLNRDIQTD